MILSDREIAAALDHGYIFIEPRPSKERWTSTAIDLTLDPVILRWIRPKMRGTGKPDEPQGVYPALPGFSVNAMTEDPNLAEKITIPDGEEGYPLGPRQFVLGYTCQKIYLPLQSRIAARVEGKSSLARLGVGVHVTAPTIHAGFGLNPNQPNQLGLPIQLEIYNLGDFCVHLAADMPICQLILEEVREVPEKGYHGQFSTQAAFKEPT
jgi:dCTP deaminase